MRVLLLFMLSLLASCSEQVNKSNIESKSKLESTSAAIQPSEKPDVVPSDLLVVKAALLKDIDSIMLQQKREKANNLSSADAGTKDDLKDDVKEVKDSTVAAPDKHQIPIRIYTPLENSNKNFVVMYVRDRGQTKEGIEIHDPICRKIANTLGVNVVYADCRKEYTKANPLASVLNDDVSCVNSWITKKFHGMEIVLSDG